LCPRKRAMYTSASHTQRRGTVPSTPQIQILAISDGCCSALALGHLFQHPDRSQYHLPSYFSNIVLSIPDRCQDRVKQILPCPLIPPRSTPYGTGLAVLKSTILAESSQTDHSCRLTRTLCTSASPTRRRGTVPSTPRIQITGISDGSCLALAPKLLLQRPGHPPPLQQSHQHILQSDGSLFNHQNYRPSTQHLVQQTHRFPNHQQNILPNNPRNFQRRFRPLGQ